MKLDEFVRQSLVSIAKGVADAQEEAVLYVAPGYVNGVRQDEGQTVEFEIAVTVSSEGGGGIEVFSLGGAKASVAREHVSRISFQVPIYLMAPTTLNKRHHTREGPVYPIDDLLPSSEESAE